MDERNSNYELQPSRNGLTVPVINGIYLHSIYNPVKEAEAFVKGHETTLKAKQYVLVLGLGFGYHIEEVAKHLNKNHASYGVIILEPNKRLVDDFLHTRSFEDKNIKIMSTEKIKDLFGDWDFISFLMKKPAIIKHDASFIIEKEFYTQFLGYQASTKILGYEGLLTEESRELVGIHKDFSVSQVFESIKQTKSSLTRNQFAMLAFEQLLNQKKKDLIHE